LCRPFRAMKKFGLAFYAFASISLFLLALAIVRYGQENFSGVQAGSFGFSPPAIRIASATPGQSFTQKVKVMRGQADKQGAVDVWVQAPRMAPWIDVRPDSRVVFPAGKQSAWFEVVVNIPEQVRAGEYKGHMQLVMLSGKKKAFSRINLGGRIDLQAEVKQSKRPDRAKSGFTRRRISDSSFYRRHKGLFLIKPEDRGKLFYLDPQEPVLYHLTNKQAAEDLVQDQAHGVSDITLTLIEAATTSRQGLSGYTQKQKAELSREIATRLSGQILLQAEGRGELWYVNPADLRRYYLGKPENSFSRVRVMAVGIANSDFAKLINTSNSRD